MITQDPKQSIENINSNYQIVKNYLASNPELPCKNLRKEIDEMANDINFLMIFLSFYLKNNDESLKELKDRESRWQEMSIKQLSFFNNLLIVLGSGFLGIAFNFREISNLEFGPAEWRPTLIFLALIFMALSVFAGLLASLNRILYFGYTHLIHRHERKYYERKLKPLSISAANSALWPLALWFYRPPNYKFLSAEYGDDSTTTNEKFKKIFRLVKTLEEATRLLLKSQWLLFLIAITLFVLALT